VIYILIDERLSNIQPQFENNCGVLYLSAQKAKDQPVAFIPLPHSKDIDFELVKTMQQQLRPSHIYVAIIDNTGNILYYQITEGFCEK
ncbi:GH21870, partial [Drosophila grimshawi]